VGHTCGARLDVPGVGALQSVGMSPGLTASFYGISESGYSFLHSAKTANLWDIEGRLVGYGLKEWMNFYRQTLNILVSTADDVVQRNGVTVDPYVSDENGPVPVVSYRPTQPSRKKRKELVKLAADLLRKAGAKKIIWSNWPPGMMIHIESTMRIGYVVDENCESFQVKQLYVADNSVHFNSLGGPNPTLTTQALAIRTADRLFQKYFN